MNTPMDEGSTVEDTLESDEGLWGTLKRILGVNLGALVIYSIAIGIMGRDNSIEFAILMLMAVAAHVFVCIILSIVRFVQKNSLAGKALLISALIIAIVGLSTCVGGAQLMRPGTL